MHTSVLLDECLRAMDLKEGAIAVDCTVGAGGHTEAMLQAVGKTGRVVGVDRDDSALALAGARLAKAREEGRLTLVKSAYSSVAGVLEAQGLTGKVDAIMADIGVSSMHLDEAERGFSFRFDGPLDMRMDRTSGRTAADFVCESTKDELTQIFREFGEEPMARKIADGIVRAREASPITTTGQLASIVEKCLPVGYVKKSKKHPATKAFQALRIAVNDELGELERLVDGAFEALAPGGRLAIITFHSLEDRIVKDRFHALTGRDAQAAISRDLPLTAAQVEARIDRRAVIVKPFPIVPSPEEIERNPRARSAKLRCLVKAR